MLAIEPRPLALSQDLPGRIAATRVAEVRARIAGIVLRRHFQAGSDVKQGQVLFTIDPAPAKAALSSKALHGYVSVGRSFETPTLAEVAYRSNSGTETGWNKSLRASTAEHYEVGLKSLPAHDVRLSTAVFSIDTENEIAVASNLGGRATV